MSRAPFVVAEGAFGLAALKARIDALDGKVDAGVQTAMYTDIAEILRRLGLWFITNIPANADLASTIALYRAGVESLRGTFNTLVSPYEASDTEGQIKRLTDAGAPLDVAEDVAVLPLMSGAPEIAQLARSRSLSLDLVAGAYFAMGALIGTDRLRGLAARIGATEHWDRLAIRRIVDDLFAGQRALTARGARRCRGARHARRWRRSRRRLGTRARRDAGARQGFPRRAGAQRRSLHRQADAGEQPDPRTGGAVEVRIHRVEFVRPVSWPATAGHPGDASPMLAALCAHQLDGPHSRAMTGVGLTTSDGGQTPGPLGRWRVRVVVLGADTSPRCVIAIPFRGGPTMNPTRRWLPLAAAFSRCLSGERDAGAARSVLHPAGPVLLSDDPRPGHVLAAVLRHSGQYRSRSAARPEDRL